MVHLVDLVDRPAWHRRPRPSPTYADIEVPDSLHERLGVDAVPGGEIKRAEECQRPSVSLGPSPTQLAMFRVFLEVGDEGIDRLRSFIVHEPSIHMPTWSIRSVGADFELLPDADQPETLRSRSAPVEDHFDLSRRAVPRSSLPTDGTGAHHGTGDCGQRFHGPVELIVLSTAANLVHFDAPARPGPAGSRSARRRRRGDMIIEPPRRSSKINCSTKNKPTWR